MCTEKEREILNILVIKIHLKSNSNSSCVESTVAYLFYFLQFRKVVGANFYGFTLGVSRLDPHPPDRPNRPISTRFQPELTLLAVGYGFPRPRPDAGGSSGGFLLQNPSHLTRPMLYTNPANSDKIKLRFEEI